VDWRGAVDSLGAVERSGAGLVDRRALRVPPPSLFSRLLREDLGAASGVLLGTNSGKSVAGWLSVFDGFTGVGTVTLGIREVLGTVLAGVSISTDRLGVVLRSGVVPTEEALGVERGLSVLVRVSVAELAGERRGRSLLRLVRGSVRSVWSLVCRSRRRLVGLSLLASDPVVLSGVAEVSGVGLLELGVAASGLLGAVAKTLGLDVGVVVELEPNILLRPQPPPAIAVAPKIPNQLRRKMGQNSPLS
jgi:hypothetical protein